MAQLLLAQVEHTVRIFLGAPVKQYGVGVLLPLPEYPRYSTEAEVMTSRCFVFLVPVER